jgi:hypothetical protein
MKMEEECRKVNGTLEVVEQETLDYVKALGDMETKSNSTKGKIGEMTRAYTELSMQYNRLTEAEKQSPYGQELSKSLNKLKGRIKDTRKDLKDVEKSLQDVEKEGGKGGLGGVLDSLAGKFGLNIGQLTKLGLAVGAAGVAFKVMKDTVMASDAGIDWWNSRVEQAKTTYQAFLQSINNSDVSGFLSRIGSVIDAANEAYSAMDALGTLQILNKRKVGEKNVEIERMRAMLRTGRYIAPNDGRSATMANGALLSDAQKEKVAKQLESAMSELRSYMHEELSATDAAIKAQLGKIGAINKGVSVEEVIRITSDNASLTEYREGYKIWAEAQKLITDASANEASTKYRKGTQFGYVADMSTMNKKPDPEVFAKEEEYRKYKDYGWTVNFNEESENFTKLNDLYKASQDIQRGIISNYVSGYKAINTTLKTTPTVPPSPALPSLIPPGAPIGGTYTGMSIQDFGGWMGANGQALLQYNMAGALNGVQGFKEEKVPVDPEKMMAGIEDLVGGLGNVASGLEAMGIELPEGVSKVLNGIGGLITVIQGISAVIVATQAIIEMNTAASFIPFAHGGVVRAANGFVGGNSWSGDRVPALLNSGELVLNKAQQGNLASQLSGAGWNNLHLETRLDGTAIRIVLNNESKSRGRGSYVTALG